MAPRPLFPMLDELNATPGINPMAAELDPMAAMMGGPEPNWLGVSQSGWERVGDIGAALMQAGGWHEMGEGPTFAQALGHGLQTANANHRDRLRDQMQERLQGYQLKRQQRQDALQEQEMRRAEEAARAQEAYIQTLPPEMQGIARMAPDKFFGRAAEMMLPDAPKPIQVGDTLVMPQADGTFQPVYRAPQKPGESWRPITAPEAERLGIPNPAGYMINNAGKVDRIEGMGGDPSVETFRPLTPAEAQQYGITDPNGWAMGSRGKPVSLTGTQAKNETWAVLSPAQAAELNLPAGQAYQRNVQTGDIEPIRGPSNGIRMNPDGTVEIGGPAGVGAPTSATTTAAQKVGVAHENITSGLSQLRQMVAEGGTALMPGERKARMDVLSRDIMLNAKEAYNLGVLNGPDLEILEDILGNPTSLTSNLTELFSTGGSPALTRLDEFQRIMDRAKAASVRSVGGTPAPATPLPPGGNLYDGVPGAAPRPTAPAAPATLPPAEDYLRDLGL